MKKDFIVRRSITMIEGKPHVETYSEQELVRCKDCKHFSFKEYWADIGHGAKILCADNCPTCDKWGNGCKTEPEGYCFLAERKED